MPATAAIQAQTFRLRTQLLEKGRREDHTFVVLQGQARFHQPDSEPQLLGKHDGILMPAGAYYKFESCGAEPLVMLRVGASSGRSNDDRMDEEGKPIPAMSAANKHEDPVGIPGKFFE